MNRRRETGKYIEARRHALAAAIVAHQYELQPELKTRYGKGGQARCVHDTEYHLSYLAAAITYSSPALFAEYIAWSKSVLAAYGIQVEDVERNLVCLRDVMAERLRSELGEDVVGELDAPLDAALQVLPLAPATHASFLDGDDPLAELARQYLQALLRVERNEAVRLVVDAVRSGVDVRDIYLRVFQPCQREIGRLWQQKEISVAQEHYCTAGTQLAMSQLYGHLFAAPKTDRRLMATSVSGELHELGLRIVTDLFEADGWETMYLGANVPAYSILQALEQYQPHVLIVSATMAYHLYAVERLIAVVRSVEAGQSVKFLVGGYPFNLDPDLWRRVGADGYASDAIDALATAGELLNQQQSEQRTNHAVDDDLISAGEPRDQGAIALYSELSRANSELLTAQRELVRTKAQLERLTQQLIEADRSKDRFLAILAHEMRTPLATIRNGLDVMRIAPGNQQLLEETRAMMDGQSEHLVRLVDDLLDVSQIVAGKVSLRATSIDLATVVRSAVDATRPLIEDAGHELTVMLPSEPLLAEGDATRLVQILSNLLRNAARYTDPGGRIELSAERGGTEAVFTVRDTGVGIPAEMLDRVFEMFIQADPSQERSRSGLGIGLTLVQRLTELHGGTVKVRSEGPGRGSEFQVRLPILSSAPAEPAPAAPLHEPAPVRVLVVDDSGAAARILAALLKNLGTESRIAQDGLQAVAQAEKFRPDLVLMDLGLPALNGLEAARRIRAEPWGKDMVLVALTGRGGDEDRQQTTDAGFDHHLLKPVQLPVIQQLLADITSRRDS